eukprot:SAG31_NODE_301_length_18103_cov_13.772551_17_plen_134_part_00
MTIKKKKRIEDSSIKFDCSACGYSGKQKKEIMGQQQKLCGECFLTSPPTFSGARRALCEKFCAANRDACLSAYIFNNPPPISGTQKIESQQDDEENKAKAGAKKEKKKKKKSGDGSTPRSPKPGADRADDDER